MSNDLNRSDAAGEFFKHSERQDGTKDLYWGDSSADEHGHAVIDSSGRMKYLREKDGWIIADDNLQD